MSESFLGEIRCFGFNFAPAGWFLCNGQLLPIQQYSALFSLLGTTYGGNGTTTFGLPNLQGQIPMHWGATGPFPTSVGDTMGTTNVTLLQTEMPQHTHTVAVVAPGNINERIATPTAAAYMAGSASPNRAYYYPPPALTINAPFSPKTIGIAGGSLPHDNMQPYLAINFCISYRGIFPSRN
jgi:microcystin-dependent protein